MAFKMFKVTTKFTVKDVIERVLRKEDGKGCEGWGVTECHEQGEGSWKKVSFTTGGRDGVVVLTDCDCYRVL